MHWWIAQAPCTETPMKRSWRTCLSCDGCKMGVSAFFMCESRALGKHLQKLKKISFGLSPEQSCLVKVNSPQSQNHNHPARDRGAGMSLMQNGVERMASKHAQLHPPVDARWRTSREMWRKSFVTVLWSCGFHQCAQGVLVTVDGFHVRFWCFPLWDVYGNETGALRQLPPVSLSMELVNSDNVITGLPRFSCHHVSLRK